MSAPIADRLMLVFTITMALLLVKVFIFNGLSWWIVFAPVWLPIAFLIAIIVVIAIFSIIGSITPGR